MKQLSLLALSLVMALSLTACGGNRGTNSGATNGGTTNGSTTNGGTTNGGITGGATNGGAVGGSGGTNRDVIGSDLDDMVKDGMVNDQDGDLNGKP